MGDSGLIDNGTAIYTTTRNVGIGTAAPNKRFQVVDGLSAEIRTTTTGNSAGNTITHRFSSSALAGAYEGGGAYLQAIQGSGIDLWNLAFGTANASATATEWMRITNAGNVGIGTAAPSERLHVVSANSLSTIIASTNASQAAVELRYNTSTTCGYFGTGAALVSGGTGPDFALRVQSGAMLFATGTTERARIDSAGNFGIGTASPYTRAEINYGTLITVNGTTPNTTTSLTLSANDPGATAGGNGVLMQMRPITNRGAVVAIGALNGDGNKDANGALTFYYNSANGQIAEGMRLNSSGNVGIGTASPLSIAGVGLTVYGATNGAFYLQNSSNNSRVVSNGNDVYIDAGAGGTGGAVVFRRSSSVTESARIDSSGNVGIGTASPGAILHTLGTGTTTGIFATTSANAWVELRRSTSTTLGYIGTGAGLVTGGAAADLAFRCESGNLLFSTGATERARIDSAGNVGIGTPAPVSYANYRTLAMAGAATGAIIDMGPGTNLQTSGGLQIATTATGTDINAQGPSGGAAAVLRFSAGTWGAVPARMLVSGSGTQAQSQVAIGTSSFTSGCSLTVAQSIDASQSAQGLKLPATPGNTDPNTLDCYADGGTANSGGVTWTPALRFGGATTGITGSQVGRYTRIGNMVFAQGTIALSSKGSATGAASIAGLPTSANVAATIYYSIAIGYNSKVTFTGQLHGLISVNSGIVELYQTSTAGVVSAITNTDFAADSVLTFTVCYPVT